MDGSYKEPSLRVSWRLTQESITDTHRDHERDFEEFAATVIRELRKIASVGASVTAGARGEYRDIRFSAARPISQEDWVNAIGDACKECSVQSDQRTWAMQ